MGRNLLELEKEDVNIIYTSLSMCKCYIETSDPVVDALSAKNNGMDVNPLSVDQMKLLIRINELQKILLNMGV